MSSIGDSSQRMILLNELVEEPFEFFRPWGVDTMELDPMFIKRVDAIENEHVNMDIQIQGTAAKGRKGAGMDSLYLRC